MTTPDRDDAHDEVDSFHPRGGPERSKLVPLFVTLGLLLVVLLIFAAIGWLRYNTG